MIPTNLIFPDFGRNTVKPFLWINVNPTLDWIVRRLVHTKANGAFTFGDRFDKLLGLEQMKVNKLLVFYGKFLK